MSTPKIGNVGLYAGGSQHTCHSPLLPTSQTQPSFRNLNKVSTDGARSSAAHGGRYWGGMGKTSWSVAMHLWLSTKESGCCGKWSINLQGRMELVGSPCQCYIPEMHSTIVRTDQQSLPICRPCSDSPAIPSNRTLLNNSA